MNNIELTALGYPLDQLPEDLSTFPGMISAPERQLLYSVARHYHGRGVIIDAGTFLGASTACFLRGIAESGWSGDKVSQGAPVRSFDLALMTPNYVQFSDKHGLGLPALDESFADHIHRHLAPYKGIYDLRIADITEYDAKDVDRIEICFLDVLKTEQVSDHCTRIFLPRLAPGALVLHQDYFFDQLPYIKVHMELFADYFEYLGEVRSTALFRCINAPDTGTISRRLQDLTLEQQVLLHADAAARTTSPARAFLMQLSAVHLLLDLQQPEQALEKAVVAVEHFYKLEQTENRPLAQPHGWRMKILAAKFSLAGINLAHHVDRKHIGF